MKKGIKLAVAFLFLGLWSFGSAGHVYAQGRAKGAPVRAQRQTQVQERKTFHQEQKTERQELKKFLKGKAPEEKQAARKAFNETQFQERKGFNQTQHQENMDFLKGRLANNPKLSDAQKTELTNYFENQYQENASFRDQRHQAAVANFQRIANDPNLTQEQKKAQIKSFMDSQKAGTKEHRQEQKQENKAKRQEIRSEVKSSIQAQEGNTSK